MKNKKIIIGILVALLLVVGVVFMSKTEDVVNVVDSSKKDVQTIATEFFNKHGLNDLTAIYEVVDATNTTYSTKSMMSTKDKADKLVVTLKNENHTVELELYASNDVIDESIVGESVDYEFELVNISRINVDYFEAGDGFSYIFKTAIDENFFGKVNVDEYVEKEADKLYLFMQRFNEMFKKPKAE